MLSKLTLANAAGEDIVIHEDSATSKRLLTKAQGLVGVGALRESKRVRPTAHGSINETLFEEGRQIHLSGEVMSQVGIEDALAEFRKIVVPMLETLDNGPALMKWTEGVTGNQLQQLVKLDSDCEPTLEEAAAFLSYPVSFFAEDPRAYSQAQTIAKSGKLSAGGGGLVFPAKFNWKFAASAGHTVTVKQLGNRPSPLVFRINGYIRNPAIIRASDNTGIYTTATVEDGSYLEIVAQTRELLMNGNTNEFSKIEAVKTWWTSLVAPPSPGEEVFTLLGESYDSNAQLEVLYRSAYA